MSSLFIVLLLFLFVLPLIFFVFFYLITLIIIVYHSYLLLLFIIIIYCLLVLFVGRRYAQSGEENERTRWRNGGVSTVQQSAVRAHYVQNFITKLFVIFYLLFFITSYYLPLFIILNSTIIPSYMQWSTLMPSSLPPISTSSLPISLPLYTTSCSDVVTVRKEDVAIRDFTFPFSHCPGGRLVTINKVTVHQRKYCTLR